MAMTPQDFYAQFLPYAQSVSQRTGLDPRLVLAQAALETGYGRSAPGQNYFGIKSHGRAGGNTLQTQEFEGGRMVSQPASFRGYESPEQSFNDYADFLLTNPRYGGVLSASGIENQIAEMAKSGYATDPNYGAKLANIAGKFDPNAPQIIAAQTMQALGRGGSFSGSNGGGAMPMGLLSMDQEPQTFGQRLKADWQRGDLQDRMALAFNSLRMNPDPNIAAMVEGRQERRETERQQNKTLEWIANLGTPQAQRALQYAEATGDIIGATKMAMEQPDELRGLQIETARVNLERLKSGADADPNVQSSAPLPDQSGVVLTMRDGTVQVRTVGGEVLAGQAALDFVRSAQENAAKYQRSIYGAREAGKLETQAELGGAAAQATSEGGMRPQIAKEFMDKAATVQSSVTNMDSAIQAIDEGAQSGIVYDMLPNVTVASAELQNARQRLGLDVIGSVTFGALSEGEMTLAMDTAVPRNLGPQELREWLVRKREAQAKAYTALQEAAMHFASGGTQADYLRKIGVGEKQPDAGQPAAPNTRLRYNPETRSFE
jgi:hypothetical protein